ncbi:S8 family serine peptidase [Rhizobacter sp. J219]|uniref:S8 family serine peptidase n=1 Tax=Rhizobacter sp. J219 TaxID=2898430 RepID=UPI0021516A2D|nr:S8 family serine peptidase [Rhizobacter sp. J219]MCR5883755.1 S8 family serine peptidase [Rhizobacter sp. J219]
MSLSRFVLLPTRGFTTDEPHNAAAIETFLTTMAEHGPRHLPAPPPPLAARFNVLDSIHSNGAKLVAMSDVALMRLKREQPGLRVVPEVFYRPARAPRPRIIESAQMFTSRTVLARHTLKVVLKETGQALRDVDVIAFSDVAAGKGAQGSTNARGQVNLEFPRSVKVLQRVYVYPAHSGWPVLLHNWPLRAGTIEVPAIALDFVDSRAKAYPKRRAGDGQGVTVGVIDTGVGPHAALTVAGGMNAVTGEDPADWSDSHMHGTHVAGIIAGQGEGFLGVSPAVTLRAYRVFGKNAEGASSFAIAKAIDRAVADGCDLLNLSLGGGPDDPTTSDAIKAARAKGVVCVIASGNEGGPVAWPARHPLAVSISAMGFKGAWPDGAMQAQTVTEPLGKEHSFIADFSNTGPEIDLTGPGVGIVSCIPQERFGVMDGTSMACPAVTGALARRLAADAATLAMPRDGDRADAIVRLALAAARDLGLPPLAQGAGLAQ